MVISHKHKYLFVELNRTASGAISGELVENYAGEKILEKHSTYREFLRIATPEEKEYFVFSCIRNPLLKKTSQYLKLRSKQTTPEKRSRWFQRAGRRKNLSYYSGRYRYNFVHKHDASFDEYFLRFDKHPYDDWSQLDHHKFDFIIRFENIQNDFKEALQRMGIELLRPLPQFHKTHARKSTDLNDFYKSDKARNRAKKNYGIYMEKWNYTFPQEWGEHNISALTRFHHSLANYMRRLYWRFL